MSRYFLADDRSGRGGGVIIQSGPWLKSYVAFTLIDQKIKQLAPPQKTSAQDSFYVSAKNTAFFAGTLAKLQQKCG